VVNMVNVAEGAMSDVLAGINCQASAEWRDRYESKVGLIRVRSIHGHNSHEEGEPACAA
jgi:hypothetical protein